MSASMSLVGALPAASRSHRRLFCFSSPPFARRRLRSFVSSPSRNANVVWATSAGEDGPDEAQQQPPSSSSAATAAPKQESAGGVGFGSDRSGSDGLKGRRKSKVIRRVPAQKPLIKTDATSRAKDDGSALPQQERAFLLVWLGLGFLILVEGIALAASEMLSATLRRKNVGAVISSYFIAIFWSACYDANKMRGFLPEEWDNLFVKYLYPSFTPTVVLFLGGAVAYGVFKYLKAGQGKS